MREDATYILVGGMGGIGRALAVKLLEWGAKNLVFLSRSGATTPAASDLIKLLQTSGAVVKVMKCDIGDIEQLESAVKEITQQLPSIKGMFHLGMIMRSALFENMTLDDWMDSLLPKVQGTWNLHNLLPKDLDFFVLISSFVVGKPLSFTHTLSFLTRLVKRKFRLLTGSCLARFRKLVANPFLGHHRKRVSGRLFCSFVLSRHFLRIS